jgi:hypothetical protein
MTNPAYTTINANCTNTDNKINRFVTVFALVFCYLDSFVKRDKPGPHTCFLLNFVYLDLLPARN